MSDLFTPAHGGLLQAVVLLAGATPSDASVSLAGNYTGLAAPPLGFSFQEVHSRDNSGSTAEGNITACLSQYCCWRS